MQTTSKKDQIYIGREAGKEIHEKIRNAKKSVKIVSPYLSADYLKDLISLHKKQIEVTLITCDKITESPYSDFRIEDLFNKDKIYDEKARKLKKALLRFFGLSIIISALLVIPASFVPVLFIFAGIIFCTGIILAIYSSSISEGSVKCEPIFRIKVFDSHSGKNPESTELIHSKIFVIDEELAFLGSTNFTYSGFKTHYETTIKVEDKNAVRDISKEVEVLYNSKELREKKREGW